MLGQSVFLSKCYSKPSYLVRGVGVRNSQRFHSSRQTVNSHENILIYEFDVASAIILAISLAMNYSHLFDEGTLARLSST